MIKALGSLLVFCGGGGVWWLQQQGRSRRRAVLADLMLILRRMQEEIRMIRTPLPDLFEKLAEQCGQETANLLSELSVVAGEGTDVNAAWCAGVCQLPISKREQELLCGVSFTGDEEKVCKELSLALYGLAQCAEQLEHSRPEEEKRAAALCFSGAALLVILLI